MQEGKEARKLSPMSTAMSKQYACGDPCVPTSPATPHLCTRSVTPTCAHAANSGTQGSTSSSPNAATDPMGSEPVASVRSPPPPPGQDLSLSSKALNLGAGLLQNFAPLKAIHQHVCAFHMYAHDATRAVRAHHYCAHLNEEVRQCILFDTDAPNARLIGIEYIISSRLFDMLPPEEQRLWHSHKYEVLSGMLVAPGVPQTVEDAEMRKLVDTYGKTWHTWQVDRGDALPLGPAQLMGAYVADGQLDPQLLASRDRDMHVNSAQVKQHRSIHIPSDFMPSPRADSSWHTGYAQQVVLATQPFIGPRPAAKM